MHHLKSMKNLFIDTNVYLKFYHFSSDDLEELKKLLVAVSNKRINLYITKQVINEFRRNREDKIADALSRFTEQKLPDQFPQICKAYDEYKNLRELLRTFEVTRGQLLVKLKNDIDLKQCGADKIINGLFDVANKLEFDEEIIVKAKTRVSLGNPPGKNNSIGDSINWELLLKNVPGGEDLHLITDDQDYSSRIERNNLGEFLDLEWKENKNSKIFYYTKLSDFLRVEFPDIKLASELEKELAIKDFISSPNFTSTHLAIKRLLNFSDFSDFEIKDLIEASTSNRQIYWIHDDPDVKSFLLNLIKGKETTLDPEMLKKFNGIYKQEQNEDKTKIDDIF